MKKNSLTRLFFGLFGLFLISGILYQLPPIHDRLSWRIEEAKVLIKGYLSPPEKVSLAPAQQQIEAIVSATLQSLTTPTPTLTATPTSAIPATPIPTLTSTPIPTPLPDKIALSGVRYMNQHGLWNYCAPANLAMALSFWGWQGDRLDTGKWLKPYDKDKNVMPYEMEAYVKEQTQLSAIVRVGGSIDLIKRFLANGFPVLVEKGAWIRDISGVKSWMGHYVVVTGYDEMRKVLITQDSYFTPDFEVSYDNFIRGWRSFNYTYIIIYPPDKENDVKSILGDNWDEKTNYLYAAQLASDEIFKTEGVDQFFAWYNRGTNLKELQDYAGAALAYDEAFKIYNALPEDRTVRPYRILWYETGPYFAYFYVGRYYDVLNLADAAINAALDEPAIEESFYWRGMAKNALGDRDGAIADFRQALKYHPNFEPALYQLNLMGVQP
ncbi:MAG: C39 family peptidase [Anaerolineales bacterium]